MEFSESELRMVRWLRQQHAGWRAVRTIILTCSIVSIAFAGWLLFRVGFTGAVGFCFVIAAGGLSYTLGSWSGRPEVSLLLKLVEAQIPDASTSNQA